MPRLLVYAWVVFVTTGCASGLEHRKVEGWPQLTVREHHVPHSEMRDQCTKYASFGGMTEACAVYDLGAGTCDIWLSADFPPSEAIVEHERLHCQGYDHVGETYMERLLARWKRFRSQQASQ
jgi:hypothetical protein